MYLHSMKIKKCRRDTPVSERIERYTFPEPNTGCHLWAGCDNLKYGVINIDHRNRLVHRVAYTLAKGPIPEGLQIDHICNNCLCVNPNHLRAVTARVNILRSTGVSAIAARKTHCPKGHPYSGENVYTWGPSNHRQCKTCRKEAMIKYWSCRR